MLRDTFAVEMLLAEAPIDQVSILLGHISVKITYGPKSSASSAPPTPNTALAVMVCTRLLRATSLKKWREESSDG